MIRKIYQEIVLIRKELQAIRSSMESKTEYVREPYGTKLIPHPVHDTDQSRLQESGVSQDQKFSG